MNKRVLTILLTAFVIALGASYLVYRVVANRLIEGAQKTTQVVVASQDVSIGSVLHDTDLSTIDISGALPKGAIVDKKEAIGRGVISNLYQGELILESRLAAPGAGGGLASTIPQGMRACAVKVDEVVGVAGFVTPGMHVDVLISGNPPGADANSANGPRVKTLLQDISVLSAGTDISRDNDGKPQQVQVVNLLVTPEQAEQLSLASNQTKIQLVLRNPMDSKIAESPGTAVANLYAGTSSTPTVAKPRPAAAVAPRVAAKPAPPPTYVIKVFNGSKQTEEKFAGEEKQ